MGKKFSFSFGGKNADYLETMRSGEHLDVRGTVSNDGGNCIIISKGI
jgi:hypothetical protein